MDASGNWKPNEKFAVREYPHRTPDHITREYNKKREQYRKRLQSLQTSELNDTKDLKSRTEKPWYDAMKKHFASNGMFSDVPKPDPLDFGITWDISDGKMPHRPYMESVQNGLIGLDQIKKFESVVDKLFAKYDIDFNFTRHFGDRMDDSRNSPSITLKELAEFIKKMYKRQGKSIKGVAGAEAVLKDIQSDLNIPVAVTYDRNNDEFDVVLKTIMRKKNFTSPDKVIKYEENDMTNQLPEGFMDDILGKNMKNRDSGNAELDEVFGATIGLGFIASTLIKVAATTLMGAIIGGEIGASRKKSAGWTARPRRENSILDRISDKATLKTMQKKYPEALEMIGKNKDIINYSKSITNTKGGPDKEQMQTLKKMIKDEFEKSGISWNDFISSVEPLVRKSVKDAQEKMDDEVEVEVQQMEAPDTGEFDRIRELAGLR